MAGWPLLQRAAGPFRSNLRAALRSRVRHLHPPKQQFTQYVRAENYRLNPDGAYHSAIVPALRLHTPADYETPRIPFLPLNVSSAGRASAARVVRPRSAAQATVAGEPPQNGRKYGRA